MHEARECHAQGRPVESAREQHGDRQCEALPDLEQSYRGERIRYDKPQDQSQERPAKLQQRIHHRGVEHHHSEPDATFRRHVKGVEKITHERQPASSVMRLMRKSVSEWRL